MTQRKPVIVTPVFEDAEAASRLFRELSDTFGRETYVVAVDDGSIRQPVSSTWLLEAGLDGVVLTLKRNVGHQRAIATGLSWLADNAPESDRVVVMDSDGEDVPSSIAFLLDRLEKDDVDVVVARRKSRVETLRFKIFYAIYRRLFRLLTGRDLHFGNFMAFNSAALHRLTAMGELGTHVAGTVLLSRLRCESRAIDRGPRYAGHSKMNFVGLALHGFKGLMVFAEDVLVRVGAACALVAALSLTGSVAAITLKSIGYATPGWFSVALGILLLMFLQTGAITLMTLMLTGVVRGFGVLPIDYRQLLAQVSAAPDATGTNRGST